MLYNRFNLGVLDFASKSDSRPELQTVSFEKDKTVATDGLCCIEVSRNNDNSKDFPKTKDNKNQVIDEADFKPFYINADDLKKLKFNKENKEFPMLNNVAVSALTDETVSLLTTDLNVASAMTFLTPDINYPDIDSVVPKEKPVFSIRVNGDKLAKMVTFLQKMCKEKEFVDLSFYGKNEAIRITAKGENGQTGKGYVMPIKQKDN